jgi:DNA-binding MurR/RpiR family transcriptional regulator
MSDSHNDKPVATPPERLSPKQRELMLFIEQNPEFSAFATATEIADRAGTHAATVVRLAQRLGHSGFPDLQRSIRTRYLASLDAVSILNARSSSLRGDPVEAAVDQDIRNLSATRAALDPATVKAVARLVANSRTSLIVGSGTHGGLALIFSHLCRFMGLNVEAELRGRVSLATRLSQMGPGDTLIGMAAWLIVEETRDAMACAQSQGVTTVAIVDTRTSSLTTVADHVLYTQTEGVSFHQSLVGPLAVLNAIVSEIGRLDEQKVRRGIKGSSEMLERLGIAWNG